MTDLSAIDHLDAQTVASLIAIIIPAITALVTKWNVSTVLRTVVALLLSAIAGAVGTLIAADGGFNWQAFALSTLYAFVVQVALYMGVYKPQGIAAAIAGATPNFGLGTPRPAELSDSGAHVVTDVPEQPGPAQDAPGPPLVPEEDAQDDDTDPEDDPEDDDPLAEEEAELKEPKQP
jgi:hypothetical protein